MEFHRLERSQVTITALTIQEDIILNNNFIQSDLGVSMQTGDSTKLANLTKTNSWWPNLTPLTVDDGSQPLETNSGRSSGGFCPQKPEPPNPPDKNSKKAENNLYLVTIWHSSALIQPRLAFLYLDPLKSSQDLVSSSLRYA